MVSTHFSDERQERRRAVTMEVNRIPLREVMENHFGFRGKKGGPNMLKYEISPGFHLNCSTTENWFASFNGAPIPGLGANGRKATGSFGAIDAVIAVRSIFGGECDFKQARAELQQAFLPQTLDDAYLPNSPPAGATVRSPPPVEKEERKELPQRFNTSDDYFNSTGRSWNRPVVRLPDSLEEHVYRYLTDERKIPASAVSALMERSAAYPSVRERRLTSRRTGQAYILAEPCVVFPLSSWRGNLVVGYDYKTLPTEPAYASFAASEGRKKFGGYLIGSWDENTRHAILTEAAIDSISKWVLERPGADTCVWGMSGARVSDLLLQECQRRGIDVRTAFDNDRAGRIAAAATLRQCTELGIPCECEFPEPSEIDFTLNADAAGERRLLELSELCQNFRLPIRPGEAEAGSIRGVVANHGDVLELFARYRDDDQLDRMTASAVGHAVQPMEPRVRFDLRNKDWNDILRGEFRPQLDWAPVADGAPRIPAAEPEP